MLRKIILLTVFLAYIVCANAQGIKFGVHVDPLLSFMNSNNKGASPSGANFGLSFGVELEYYFADGENYALTFGGNFALGKGGRLAYNERGILLPNSELDRSAFLDGGRAADPSANPPIEAAAPKTPLDGKGLELTQGTSIRYNINYVELPVGLKLRTNELGNSYLRAFFHLPVVTPMIAVSARGKIEAPDAISGQENIYGGSSKGENVYSDVVFFQLMIGTGAGVEFSPNEEGGLRLVGGIYYNYGFIDSVKKQQTFDSVSGNLRDFNPVTGFHNIGLRIGIIF